jgi:hypothetical protein
MSDQLLPCVTRATAEIVEEAISDTGQSVLVAWLDQMQAENPLLADEVRAWAQKMQDASSVEPHHLLMGPAVVYQLLRAQAQSDSMKS